MDENADDKSWQRLNEIFSAAQELDEAELEAYLHENCEPELRAEAVKLLAAHRKVSEKRFLEKGIFAAGKPETRFDERQEEDLRGKRIGSYRIVREIGRGGMGAVYLAERDDAQFRQRVALKIIKRGMDWDEIVRRFRRERQVLAALNHPYIARLFDGGTTEEGLPFFVMEYVEGMPVTQYCDEHKLGIEERLRLFQKICSSVSYIHENAIIHRDIKPSNIFVCADGTPKLLDFGIVKLLADGDPAATLEQTATGLHLFTPQYASPEQINGEPVTFASDIYNLGVLLYELLCGHHPLDLKNRSRNDVLKIISEQDPTAPSFAAGKTGIIARDDNTKETLMPERVAAMRGETPERLRRSLRGDLDNITLTALRKDPAERYRSVEEFSEDIGRYLENLPVRARRSTAAYRAAKFIRRNPAAVAAAFLAVLLATVAAFFFYTDPQTGAAPVQTAAAENSVRKIAVLPFKLIGGESEDTSLGKDLSDSLIGKLGRMPELEIRSSSAVAAFAGEDPLETGKALLVDTVLESTVEKRGELVKINSRLLKTDDGQVLWSGEFEENFDRIFDAQDAIAERVAGALLGQLTVEQRRRVQKRYTDNPEAYRLYLQGKYLRDRQSEEALKRSIQLFNRAIELDPGYALAYSGIADAYSGLSAVYLAPREAKPKAKAAALRALELDSDLSDARVLLALTLEAFEWNFAAAEVEYRRAIQINPHHAGARHWYARFLALTGRFEESAEQFKRAAELDPLSPFIALDANFVYFNRRDYDRAIEQINKAIELNDDFWFAWWVRGWARQEKGDINGAIEDYRKAYSIGKSPVPYAYLANAYAVSGRKKEARKILGELLELGKKQYVGEPVIAAVYAGLGEEEQALEWLEKGIEERNDLMIWLKFDHRFGRLRNDARFGELLQRVGLPEQTAGK